MPKPKYVTDWSQVPLVVDVPYVSMLLGLHPRTIEKHLKNGSLKGFKAGKSWRIRKEALAKYMGIENATERKN